MIFWMQVWVVIFIFFSQKKSPVKSWIRIDCSSVTHNSAEFFVQNWPSELIPVKAMQKLLEWFTPVRRKRKSILFCKFVKFGAKKRLYILQWVLDIVNLEKSSLYQISSLYREVLRYSEYFWPFFTKIHDIVKI